MLSYTRVMCFPATKSLGMMLEVLIVNWARADSYDMVDGNETQ